jgi:phage major head subunit gpT-like protein
MIINSASLANLTTGFKAAFQAGQAGASPSYLKVATVVPSLTAQEFYAWLKAMPKLREWLGDRQLKNVSTDSYSIVNKDYEATVEVEANKIADDQYGIYTPIFQQLGASAAMHPDELVFALLAAAFTTDCYDGQYMIDTDHSVAGSSVSNHGGGAGAAWFLLDTSRPLKPLIYQQREAYKFAAMDQASDEAVFMRKSYRYGVDGRCAVGFGFWQQIYGSKVTLDATNFDSAVAAMMAFKDDEGRPLGVMPNLLVCGPSNRAAARALLLTPTLTGGAANPNYGAAELLVSPLLT